MPTVVPEGICRSMSERAYFFAVREYLNETPSKSTEPSGISYMGCSGFVSAGVSTSTSPMRAADSADMVRMT